jgi:outer membrane protein assembly factor BamD
MKQSARFWSIIAIALLGFAVRSPAPLVFEPDEGWTYEKPGETTAAWQRTRAKDQFAVAQQAFDKKDYGLALKAALRVEKRWPFSDYAPRAQYLVGRSYEALHEDERAFNAYQRILEHNPKAENYQEILGRQYEIANRYLNGEWFKMWNMIPAFPSMDKTAGMYEKIIKNGPYSDVAAQSQLKLGQTHEKESDLTDAVKDYETASDRYSDRPKIAADALYQTGLAYKRQVKSADYDHNVAQEAIASFTDFITLYPGDPRVADAQKFITVLKTEAARGSFSIAQYYEKNKKWQGALVYYNDTLVQDPNSKYAQTARQKIVMLKAKMGLPAVEPTVETTGQPEAELTNAAPESTTAPAAPAPETSAAPAPPAPETASAPATPAPEAAAAPAAPAAPAGPRFADLPPATETPEGQPPAAAVQQTNSNPLATSHGYKLGPVNGEIAGEKSVEIQPFLNHTLEPYLTDAVTTELRRRLQEDGTYRLATHDDGDMILSGVITKYNRAALSYQPTDTLTARDFKLTITAEVTVRSRSTGQVLLEKTITGSSTMRTGNDLAEAERQTLPLLAEDLAKNVISLLTEGSW